jgi:hypothetical protein
MKTRFNLFRRNGVFYTEDTTNGKQSSLRTRDETEARSLLNARNEAQRQPVLNLHLARAYERQLDRDLDVLDGMIAAEVQAETVEYFSGERPEQRERSIQETSGIPTGVAFDLHKQIEKLRAKQTAEQEKSQAEAFVRQVQTIREVAAVLPKDITPAIAELAPPKPAAPDNLAPETFELPPAPPESSA